VLEIKVTSFGLLAVGGLLSLVLGSMMLFDSPLPELQLSLRIIVPLVFSMAGIILFLVKLAVDAQRRRAFTGTAGMIAARGQALTAIPGGGTGRVSTHGEIWNATSEDPLAEGEEIEVLAIDGLTLRVRRAGRTAGRVSS
jgi:membrane-bound serine protease (ClpP class)